MNKKKEYNKSEKTGIVIYIILLIGYIIWLINFLYFSEDFEYIINSFREGNNHPIYFFIFYIGLFTIGIYYYLFVEAIFYPNNELDKKIKQIKKHYRNNHSMNLKEKNKEIKKLKLKYNLKELEKK